MGCDTFTCSPPGVPASDVVLTWRGPLVQAAPVAGRLRFAVELCCRWPAVSSTRGLRTRSESANGPFCRITGIAIEVMAVGAGSGNGLLLRCHHLEGRSARPARVFLTGLGVELQAQCLNHFEHS